MFIHPCKATCTIVLLKGRATEDPSVPGIVSHNESSDALCQTRLFLRRILNKTKNGDIYICWNVSLSFYLNQMTLSVISTHSKINVRSKFYIGIYCNEFNLTGIFLSERVTGELWDPPKILTTWQRDTQHNLTSSWRQNKSISHVTPEMGVAWMVITCLGAYQAGF